MDPLLPETGVILGKQRLGLEIALPALAVDILVLSHFHSRSSSYSCSWPRPCYTSCYGSRKQFSVSPMARVPAGTGAQQRAIVEH